MTTGKTMALTRWTCVEKVMSLLLNMLSKLVITFLPRSKHLLISWLQLPSAVILEPRKIKLATVSIVSPSICHEGKKALIPLWGLHPHDLNICQMPHLLRDSCCPVAQPCLSLCDPMNCSTRLPCPSLSPRIYSNSCPLSKWCHPIVSSSAVPFSSCPQCFPASGSFPWVGSSHQVAKVLELQLQHQFFQWDSGLTSFRIVWFDLLAVQATLKGLL